MDMTSHVHQLYVAKLTRSKLIISPQIVKSMQLTSALPTHLATSTVACECTQHRIWTCIVLHEADVWIQPSILFRCY